MVWIQVYTESWLQTRQKKLILTLFIVAWENSRYFATSPLVSRGTSAEIPNWWRVTIELWVMLLIGWLVYTWEAIGYFRVAPSLSFKARRSVKLIFTREVLHLASVWKRESFWKSKVAYWCKQNNKSARGARVFTLFTVIAWLRRDSFPGGRKHKTTVSFLFFSTRTRSSRI